MNTSWMWGTDDGGVNGATIDPIDRVIHWFEDAAACACGDSAAVQSFEQFEQRGAALSTIPDDVLQELRDTLQQF